MMAPSSYGSFKERGDERSEAPPRGGTAAMKVMLLLGALAVCAFVGGRRVASAAAPTVVEDVASVASVASMKRESEWDEVQEIMAKAKKVQDEAKRAAKAAAKVTTKSSVLSSYTKLMSTSLKHAEKMATTYDPTLKKALKTTKPAELTSEQLRAQYTAQMTLGTHTVQGKPTPLSAAVLRQQYAKRLAEKEKAKNKKIQDAARHPEGKSARQAAQATHKLSKIEQRVAKANAALAKANNNNHKTTSASSKLAAQKAAVNLQARKEQLDAAKASGATPQAKVPPLDAQMQRRLDAMNAKAHKKKHHFKR